MYIMTTSYDNRVYEVANPDACTALNGRHTYDMIIGGRRYRCPFDLRAHPLHPTLLAQWDADEQEFFAVDNPLAEEIDYA